MKNLKKVIDYSDEASYPFNELMINKKINIAVVGLGQVGSYLLNELNTKKRYRT